jgi:hypothetical protein
MSSFNDVFGNSSMLHALDKKAYGLKKMIDRLDGKKYLTDYNAEYKTESNKIKTDAERLWTTYSDLEYSERKKMVEKYISDQTKTMMNLLDAKYPDRANALKHENTLQKASLISSGKVSLGSTRKKRTKRAKPKSTKKKAKK